ncbi:MAG: BREX system ATP-binding protein BrxD [Myxococcota bacterium]
MTVNREHQPLVMALRDGIVPPAGLELLATGLEPLTAAVVSELELVGQGHGASKWIRGAYGTGKTFTTRFLCAEARRLGFATSEVQISINDTPLHHLETVYRRLIERLTTAADGVGAFRGVVDGWLYEIGEQVRGLQGLDESDPRFADATEQKLAEKLAELSKQSDSFARVLAAYHRSQHEGDFAGAQGLLSWLGGQPHVGHAILGRAGVRGAVDGQAALTFLRGVLLVLRQSGYRGLVVVLDEVETIQRMPSQTREKSLNVLRQLIDQLGNGEYPGLYLVVTGTPEFFDGYKGLKGLQPLYERVAVKLDPKYPNYRAVQIELRPFDAPRLLEVGRKVRALFPEAVRARVDDSFLEALVATLTGRFGGKVAITPRLFLRELIEVLNQTDQHDRYDPHVDYALAVDEAALEPTELAALKGLQPEEVERSRRLDE